MWKGGCSSYRLRDLVLVVWEDQVDAARMQVDGGAEEAAGHSTTLDVPPGTALAQPRLPEHGAVLLLVRLQHTSGDAGEGQQYSRLSRYLLPRHIQAGWLRVPCGPLGLTDCLACYRWVGASWRCRSPSIARSPWRRPSRPRTRPSRSPPHPATHPDAAVGQDHW